MAHAPELHSPVRALAWRLSSGEISWSDYRQRRAATVRTILAGEQPLEYKPPVVNEDATTPKHHDTHQVFIDMDEVERPPSRAPAFVAMGVLGAVILGAGYVLWQSAEPPVVASAPVVDMGAAESLLDGFVRAAAWEPAAVDALADAWQELSADEKTAVESTVAWRRLQNQLRENINQQRVLASVDETGEAQRLLERLLELQRVLNRATSQAGR